MGSDLVLTPKTCFSISTLGVIHVASNKNNIAPGASGEVQDHQEHHQDDQEPLQDHFYVDFTSF